MEDYGKVFESAAILLAIFGPIGTLVYFYVTSRIGEKRRAAFTLQDELKFYRSQSEYWRGRAAYWRAEALFHYGHANPEKGGNN